MVKKLQHPAQPLRVGLGRPADRVQTLRRSLAEAIEALAVEKALGRVQGVADFAELGMLHWLEQLSEEELEENKYYTLVWQLDQHDRQHNGEMLETLSVFLKTGSQRSTAATQLNIHRNTLRYRLERIEEIIGLSLDKPRVHHELLTAIRAYQLRQAR
jgi:DNA-binding PucR family transcriptional regulator